MSELASESSAPRLAGLTQRTWSLFEAVGGWRTVAEGVVSRLLFLVTYLLTGEVAASALVAVGGVAVLAVVRVWTDRKYWQAAIGLIVVGGSALFAGVTGNAVDFYLSTVLMQVGGGALVLLSMLVGWPVVGLVVAAARGEGAGWRRDAAQRRSYQACTAVLVVKFGIAIAVLVPLYLADHVVALGIAAATLGGSPAMGLCFYLCWRILASGPGAGRLTGLPRRDC
jgi:hypothetical protein